MKLLQWMRALRATALGVWLGGLVMVFIAAPIVFQGLAPDRNKPGEIVGNILHTALLAKLGLAAFALACEAYIYFRPAGERPSGWRRQLPAALLLLAIALALGELFYIEPRINELRTQIGTFTEANVNSPERLEFGRLHGVSVITAMGEVVVVLAALIAGLL